MISYRNNDFTKGQAKTIQRYSFRVSRRNCLSNRRIFSIVTVLSVERRRLSKHEFSIKSLTISPEDGSGPCLVSGSTCKSRVSFFGSHTRTWWSYRASVCWSWILGPIRRFDSHWVSVWVWVDGKYTNHICDLYIIYMYKLDTLLDSRSGHGSNIGLNSFGSNKIAAQPKPKQTLKLYFYWSGPIKCVPIAIFNFSYFEWVTCFRFPNETKGYKPAIRA